MLDRLIEEYVTENQQRCVLVQKNPGTVKINLCEKKDGKSWKAKMFSGFRLFIFYKENIRSPLRNYLSWYRMDA